MRHIIVIGSTKGFGKAIAEKSLENGFKVSGFARSESEINHDNYTHYTSDALEGNYQEIDAADAMVFCPGNINLKPISMLKDSDFEKDFAVNTLSAVKATKHFLPSLKKGSNAQILFFSTVAVQLGMPFHCSTAAAKGALEGFSRALAAEMAPSIAVNCLAPTISHTPMGSKILRNEKVLEKLTNKHPMSELPNPEQMAEAAWPFINGKVHTISGQVLNVDAGLGSLNLN